MRSNCRKINVEFTKRVRGPRPLFLSFVYFVLLSLIAGIVTSTIQVLRVQGLVFPKVS